MSYRLNKTNGDLLIDLVDGQIDTTTTDITLVGRNYKGYGEYLNENFIGLLENFSGTSAPGNPISGQLWYDTAEERLKVYDGTSFKAAGGPILSNTQPIMVAGDLWIDTANQQMYFYDGNLDGNITLVGPEYSKTEQKTGFEVASVVDSVSQQRTILKLFIENRLVGVFTQVPGTGTPGANDTFYVEAANAIAGYPEWADDTQTPKRQRFQDGFNPVDTEFWYRGTATTARSLTDDVGNEYTDANFMRTDENTGTTGSIRIRNSAGLSVGVGDTEYIITKVDSASGQTIIENQQNNSDMLLKTRQGNNSLNAIYIDASEAKIGLWKTAPEVELDVEGSGRFANNLEVEGNLTVRGDTTYLNVATLRVEDKNIELGLLDDSTEGNDIAVDGAGIIVRSTNGSKDWTWENTTSCWTSNQDIDITVTPDNPVPEYKINGSAVLSSTTLSSSVTSALGLTEIGTLTYLNVDNLNIDGVTITTTGSGLNLTSAGTITVNSNKITGVAEPTTSTDVATKNYVDTQIDADNVGFSLDITGLTTPYAPGVNDGPYTDVLAILNSMYPASTKNGATATVHCTSYAGVTVTISQAALQTAITDNNSYISVDKDGSFSSESVVQDVAISAAGVTGSATISPTRYTMTFTSNGVTWSHTGTSNYP